MDVRKALPALMFLLVLATGCRKDKDTTGPVIELVAPGPGTTLSVPDTLIIRVNVSDDNGVENVWLSVSDENGVPVAATIVVPVNKNSASILRGMPLNGSISTGTYTLNVRARDTRDNTSSTFRPLNISGSPPRLRGVFLVPQEGGEIVWVDSVGVQSAFHSLGEIGVVAVNARSQHLYVAGGPYAPLRMLSANNGSSGEIQNQNAQSGPYFTHLVTDPADGLAYVSSNDGMIRGYHGVNDQRFSAQAMPDHRPYASVIVNDRLMSEQRANGPGGARLVAYTRAYGALLDQHPLDLEVVRMFAHSNNEVLVFGNRDGKGVIQLRNTVQGGNYEMREFSEGMIKAVARLAGNNYAVALPGQVKKFNASSNSASPFLGMTANDVAYESATGALFVADGQQIHVVDPNTGATQYSIQAPYVPGRVLPLADR
jgi:hypothetical protein